MKVSDFSYDLPVELIAQHPAAERRGSRLLRLEAEGECTDLTFGEFGKCLQKGDLIVLNDTRVIPARLLGRKETGGRVEILIERLLKDGTILAQLRSSKSPCQGQRLEIDGAESTEFLKVQGRQGSFYVLAARGISDLTDWLGGVGHMPLPPYIERTDRPEDQERYQTVYAQNPGAVAAPTAGLHLDEIFLAGLDDQGIEVGRLTLHVGAGTFQPIRTETVEDHVMHGERVVVSKELCDAIVATRARGGRVVAIGTTVVRSLESAFADGALRPFDGDTQIFIYPGYRFRVVDALLTNFHLPESTLLMLVSAFAGKDPVMNAYRHAVEQSYRFFSYGDAMFVCRREVTADTLNP